MVHAIKGISNVFSIEIRLDNDEELEYRYHGAEREEPWTAATIETEEYTGEDGEDNEDGEEYVNFFMAGSVCHYMNEFMKIRG